MFEDKIAYIFSLLLLRVFIRHALILSPVNMSILQRFLGFGSKKNDQPSKVSPADAIQNLSDVEEMLGKRQVVLETQIDDEKKKAVALSKQGNKRGAIAAMKRMKRYEKTLGQIDGTLTTLEMQRESLHDATSNAEVFRVMRTAANALKKSNEHLDPEQVEQLKEDLDEQHTLGKAIDFFTSHHRLFIFFFSIADEINRAISTPTFGSEVYDNDELERELNALANEAREQEEMPHLDLPDVPTTKIQKKNNEDPLQKLADFAS